MDLTHQRVLGRRLAWHRRFLNCFGERHYAVTGEPATDINLIVFVL